MNLSITPT